MTGPRRTRAASRFTVLAVVAMILSALPLAIYPVVLVANIMSLSAAEAYPSPDVGAWVLIPKAFLWLSTAYPLVWLVAVIIGVAKLVKRESQTAMAAASVPLVYLGVMAILFRLWMG